MKNIKVILVCFSAAILIVAMVKGAPPAADEGFVRKLQDLQLNCSEVGNVGIAVPCAQIMCKYLCSSSLSPSFECMRETAEKVASQMLSFPSIDVQLCAANIASSVPGDSVMNDETGGDLGGAVIAWIKETLGNIKIPIAQKT